MNQALTCIHRIDRFCNCEIPVESDAFSYTQENASISLRHMCTCTHLIYHSTIVFVIATLFCIYLVLLPSTTLFSHLFPCDHYACPPFIPHSYLLCGVTMLVSIHIRPVCVFSVLLPSPFPLLMLFFVFQVFPSLFYFDSPNFGRNR